jgi:hypothetical protein
MNEDVKTTTNRQYLLDELAKCQPLTKDNTERAAIIEWRLKQTLSL